MKAYTNAKVFNGSEFMRQVAVLTDKHMVVDIVAADAVPSGYAITDLQQQFLAPAFIDIQIYGGNGKLFSEKTVRVLECSVLGSNLSVASSTSRTHTV